MSSTSITTKDVCYGVPTYPNIPDGQTAIVAGANGVSGQYMLKLLADNPKRWKKVYALSRRPPVGIDAPNIEHIALDFLSGVENIKATLASKNVKADYVFFFAYKQVSGGDSDLWGGQDQMTRENGRLGC
jgi:hypothetical protein